MRFGVDVWFRGGEMRLLVAFIGWIAVEGGRGLCGWYWNVGVAIPGRMWWFGTGSKHVLH